jgi:hypothetical protein
MRPYLIIAKLMRPSNMKRFPTPGLHRYYHHLHFRVQALIPVTASKVSLPKFNLGVQVTGEGQQEEGDDLFGRCTAGS